MNISSKEIWNWKGKGAKCKLQSERTYILTWWFVLENQYNIGIEGWMEISLERTSYTIKHLRLTYLGIKCGDIWERRGAPSCFFPLTFFSPTHRHTGMVFNYFLAWNRYSLNTLEDPNLKFPLVHVSRENTILVSVFSQSLQLNTDIGRYVMGI